MTLKSTCLMENFFAYKMLDIFYHIIPKLVIAQNLHDTIMCILKLAQSEMFTHRGFLFCFVLFFVFANQMNMRYLWFRTISAAQQPQGSWNAVGILSAPQPRRLSEPRCSKGSGCFIAELSHIFNVVIIFQYSTWKRANINYTIVAYL